MVSTIGSSRRGRPCKVLVVMVLGAATCRRSDLVDPIVRTFNEAADGGQTSCWQRFPCRSLHESIERIISVHSPDDPIFYISTTTLSSRAL